MKVESRTERTVTVRLAHYVSNGRDWVAELVGVDPKYGFKREFLDCEKDWSSSGKTGNSFYELENGKVYEINEPYKGRWIVKVEDGKLVDMTKEEAKQYFQEKEQKEEEEEDQGESPDPQDFEGCDTVIVLSEAESYYNKISLPELGDFRFSLIKRKGNRCVAYAYWYPTDEVLEEVNKDLDDVPLIAEIYFDLVVEPRNAEEYLSLPWDNVKVKLMGGEKVWNCSLQL